MGMDVYGKKPTTEEGKYFRNSVWGWRPLAHYICITAPDLASQCKYWQTNDGDGLEAEEAAELAERIQAEIDSGRTLQYEKRYTSELEMMPDEECHICAGTGTRLPIPNCGAGDPKNGGLHCNGCDGKGHVRPSDTHYPFETSNVQEFVTFLRGSGGFEIC